MRRCRVGLAALVAGLLATPGRADVPFPTCENVGCADPADFGSYLFLPPDVTPNDFDATSGDAWKFLPDLGMDVLGAWQRSTGRPDVVVAILDSGIRWHERDVASKVALNPGELPFPEGCSVHDCNGDGFVSVADYPDVEENGNGRRDGQDLILFYGNGVDDDGNGFIDDIAGWDFYQDDNDPFDDVDYGHGTGEAGDQVAEANDTNGMPGFAPSSLFLPLRVGDSFVAMDSDFAQAVVYATDRGVDVISEALGTLNASPTGQAAVDYAYRSGIPIIASAADEEARHHNMPANYEHTIWVNSIVHGDGTLVVEGLAEGVADLLNGCTNFGGRAWVAISSNSCSSEATGRAGGLALLLVSHGKNLIDRGLLTPYPGTDRPFSAEEVRQLLRASADDIDHSGEDLTLTVGNALIAGLLSAPALELFFGSARFPTLPGWDQYTGYGRPDAARLLDLAEEGIPPEADLSGSVRWFDVIDPVATPSLPVIGSARAVRAGNTFDWTLDVGCGIEPTAYQVIGSGASAASLDQAILATWDAAATAADCGFDLATPATTPDGHTVTLRLRVEDGLGRVGEDRRAVALDHDPTLRFAPLRLSGSGESPPVLADVNRDGVLDVIHATGDGVVHARSGATGADLPGFPVTTDPIPVHPSPGYASGEVPVPHEGVLGAAAAGDLEGDGRTEIVVASIEGKLYVFDDHGEQRPGFPVTSDPALSAKHNRDPLNDTDPGFLAAPTLADLDGPGGDPALEILISGFDGHLYAWRADATPAPGFPVRLADPGRVTVDPATGKATPLLLPEVDAKERAAKAVGSPAVGDLDGDGFPEIVATTNEEYGREPDGFAPESNLLTILTQIGGELDGFELDASGRVYVVHHDGGLHAGGAFRAGWPARVPLLTTGLLPTVATGVPGSPALADLDAGGELSVAIFGAIGPVVLLDPDAQPRLGFRRNRQRVLAADFPDDFPNVPETAGSPDAPFMGALGSGAFGDLTGDGLPEYVAPTGGIRQLIDVAAPASQEFGDHQVSAWNPRDGQLLPAFPRVMEDMQFLTSPGLADVDGDGVAEILQGSGSYLLHAWRADGTEPPGWPKFTHGWLIASPAAGDVDGDGKIEVVATTRERRLFVWDTPAPATESAIPWQGFGRDRHHTQNLASGVSALAAPGDPLAALAWALEALVLDIEEHLPEAEGEIAAVLGGPVLLPGLAAALAALAADDVPGAVDPLRDLEGALARAAADPVVTGLHLRFVQAVGDAAHGLVANASCDALDLRCERRRRRGVMYARAADVQWMFLGRAPGAVRFWGKAIELLAPIQAG